MNVGLGWARVVCFAGFPGGLARTYRLAVTFGRQQQMPAPVRAHRPAVKHVPIMLAVLAAAGPLSPAPSRKHAGRAKNGPKDVPDTDGSGDREPVKPSK